jgi:hypothetical protein
MRSLVVLLSLGLLVGCGDSGVVQPTDDVAAKDSLTDTPSPADTAIPDTAQPDAAQPDTATEDAGAPSTCEPGEGCFGESCASADDCLSGICTMHLGDKVCSKTCDEACPQGWDCTLVGSGGDGQYVCMSKFSHLCLPCETSEGCAGDVPNACVKYADGTRFCGGACDLETPCPSGYACQEIETADGANSYQCVNTAGMCPCSNLAINSALATSCETTNEEGTCVGVRVCEEMGLSACSAGEASVEVCNGVDDNCDGDVDEDTCDDGNVCTVDTCQGEGGCTYEGLTGDECLDGDICTVTDHCEDGVCVGQPVNCDDDNPCTVDSCDGLGGCQQTPASQLCDDGDPCTLGDVCKEGACVGSATLTCDDNNPCTDDSCGEAGCLFEPNALGCDDGNACTSGDACAAGGCKGEQVACDDGNLCTTDSCDFDAGCVNANNTQPCDDGDGCTQGDMCADGACSSGAAATCDDGNPCTDDACDGNLGCIFGPNASDCDDKNSCTTDDSCVEGNCIGLGDLSCDDSNPCTVDVCLADGGCKSSPVAGACDDGDACTVNDSCKDGACQSGLNLSCDDGNPCTDQSCDSGDCLFSANTTDCDDGNACTSGDACKEGWCSGGASISCNDDNPCTDDACDIEGGCLSAPNVLPCEDGDPCTVGDSCADGVCQAGEGTMLEICDGVDNDCNGEVDEGFGTSTCGVGECEHTIANCEGGETQVCDPFEGASAEVCDGKDNDCNGETDDGGDLCDADFLCQDGSCVPKCQAVNGEWSEWDCGGCSEACGGGVINCTRTCNNPSPSCGGAECAGQSTKQESCNTEPCCYQVSCGFHYYCVNACAIGCGGCNVPGCSYNGWDCSGPGIVVQDWSDCNGVCP